LGLYTFEDGFEDAMDLMGMLDPMPGPSDMIRSVLKSMVETYSANLEWDSEWAENWGYDDGWSSREDSSWVMVAIGEGLHDAFDIDLPFTDKKYNPLPVMASGGPVQMPDDNGGLRNVLAKPTQIHHIASPLCADAAKFRRVFKLAGMNLEDSAIKIAIPHSGRHSKQYHQFILTKLQTATKGKSGKAAQVALRSELKRLGNFIKANPHFMYNTSGGKRTGWNGMRDYVKAGKRGGAYRYRGPRR
jgi:hypothetical protein